MTTHDQHTGTISETPAEPEFSSARAEAPAATQDEPPVPTEPPVPSEPPQAETVPQSSEVPAAAQSEPSSHAEPAQAETVQAETAQHSAEVQPSAHELLFAADPSGLRSRWDDIQAAFVDDPAQCVQQADGLVEEVINQLTSGFADARSHLEAQWARGENASTEDLRLALTRYREFFQRLLAV